MAPQNLVNTSSGNGLLSDSTGPLPEPMLGNHEWVLVALTWGQFHRKCSRYLSWISAWNLLIQDYSYIFQRAMRWLYFAGFLLCIKPWFMPGRGSPYAVSHMWYCVMPAWGQQCSCRWPGALMREYLSADALCSYFVWVMSLLAYVWDQPILINSL